MSQCRFGSSKKREKRNQQPGQCSLQWWRSPSAVSSAASSAHRTVGHSSRVELWENFQCLRTRQETRQFLQNTELFLEYVSVLLPGVADRSEFLSAAVGHVPLWKHVFACVAYSCDWTHYSCSPSLFSHHIYWLNYSSSSDIISCLTLLILSILVTPARMRGQEQRFGHFLNSTFY